MIMETKQFSEETIRAGKLFERLDSEQKAVILALLDVFEDVPNINADESTSIHEDMTEKEIS